MADDDAAALVLDTSKLGDETRSVVERGGAELANGRCSAEDERNGRTDGRASNFLSRPELPPFWRDLFFLSRQVTEQANRSRGRSSLLQSAPDSCCEGDVARRMWSGGGWVVRRMGVVVGTPCQERDMSMDGPVQGVAGR